jgi:inosose dehydratase
MTDTDRIAAAPISWGVCEVPGWGTQLPPARVLQEMRDVGITATEFGPEGYLGDDPQAAAELLGRYALRLVGGFVPAALHRPGGVEDVERAADVFAGVGADVLVVAAATGEEGYDERLELDDDGWRALVAGLDAAQELCTARGLRCALHPHMGTLVEGRPEVERVLASSTVALCLDTGHLLIGGTDPVALLREAAERVSHVHLKDVDPTVAARVGAGELSYTDGIAQGLYAPLGQGAIDVPAFVDLLESRGYDGWYVLEQDVVLTGEPAAGEGPLRDVAASAEYLRSVLERVGAR